MHSPIHMYIHVHSHTHTQTHVHIHTHMQWHMHTHKHTCTHTCTHMCTQTHMHTPQKTCSSYAGPPELQWSIAEVLSVRGRGQRCSSCCWTTHIRPPFSAWAAASQLPPLCPFSLRDLLPCALRWGAAPSCLTQNPLPLLAFPVGSPLLQPEKESPLPAQTVLSREGTQTLLYFCARHCDIMTISNIPLGYKQ